jgi:hypothetical protein
MEVFSVQIYPFCSETCTFFSLSLSLWLVQLYTSTNYKSVSYHLLIDTFHQEEIFINDYEEYATIREIKSHYSNQIGASKRAKSSPPFLVARILKKRSINNYATALQKDNRYPFNFTVTIGDHTGQIDMIIWASWCVRYFNTLQVGDVIIIRNYRIRHSYRNFLSILYLLSINTQLFLVFLNCSTDTRKKTNWSW